MKILKESCKNKSRKDLFDGAKALKLLRTIHGFSLSEMAKQLDISRSYLSEIENNKKKPSLNVINRFGVVFKTPPSAILFFLEEARPQNYKTNIKKILLKLLMVVDAAKQ